MSEQWYYAKGGQRNGPITPDQLRQLASVGTLLPTDLVWKQGMSQWDEARKIKGLFPMQTAADPSLPPPVPTTATFASPSIPIVPTILSAPSAATISPPSLTLQSKVQYFIADFAKRGIGQFVAAPPVWRLAWALGVDVPPPHFMRFGQLTLFSGCLFAILWGFVEWIMGKASQGAFFVAFTSVIFGVLFGICLAAYYRHVAGKLNLPLWEQYPNGSPTTTPSPVIPHQTSATPLAPALWNPKWLGAWSLLFSWAFGAFLLARNWKALGEPGKAKRAMIWFYLIFPWLLLCLLTPNTPLVQKGFWFASLAMLGAFVSLEVKPQRKRLKEQFNDQFIRKSWWKPIGIACGSVLGVIVMLVVVAAIADSGQDFGTALTFNGSQLFYKPPVTEKEARTLGQYLVESWFSDVKDPKTVQLTKSGSTYECRVPIKKGLENDQESLQQMKAMAQQLSRDVFNNAEVDIHMCDDELNTIRVVVP